MQNNSRKIRAIIFDLDDTLYDCSGTLVLRGRKQVAAKIAGLIKCSEEEVYNLQLEMEEKYGVRENIYEKIVSYYHLPNLCAQELLEEFVHVDISNIILFPDVTCTLMHLKSQGYLLILITAGEKQIQEKKIRILGLNNNYFDYILIADKNNEQTKTEYFKQIMQQYKLKPAEIICIGDKIDDELTAGKSLGMVTVMFEHGRHYKAYLKARDNYIKPDYFIRHIKDIPELCCLNNF